MVQMGKNTILGIPIPEHMMVLITKSLILHVLSSKKKSLHLVEETAIKILKLVKAFSMSY